MRDRARVRAVEDGRFSSQRMDRRRWLQFSATAVLLALFGRFPIVPVPSECGFLGEINGLNQPPQPIWNAFLLASVARILYPVVCMQPGS